MLNLRERILNFWGQELVSVSAEIPIDSRISENTARFLREVGLPIRGELTTWLNKYLNLEFCKNNEILGAFSINDTLYFSIASDPALKQAKICLSSTNDSIYSVALFEKLRIHFINSNLEAFLTFLEIYITYWCNLFENTNPSSAAMLEVINKMELEFKKIDAKALEDENFYWSEVLDDAKIYHAGFVEDEDSENSYCD